MKPVPIIGSSREGKGLPLVAEAFRVSTTVARFKKTPRGSVNPYICYTESEKEKQTGAHYSEWVPVIFLKGVIINPTTL